MAQYGVMRLIILFLLALLLSACWMGPEFYSVTQHVQAVPEGVYKLRRVVTPFEDELHDETPPRVRISYAPDGRALITDLASPDDATPTLLVKLAGHESVYIAQANLSVPEAANLPAVYGLIEVLPDGYKLILPPCDGARRLKGHIKAYVKGPLFGIPVCRFKDKASFEEAMQKVVADPVRWTIYRRVKPRDDQSAQTSQR
jgi:hypothetical protein